MRHVAPGAVLCFMTLRNAALRLPYFLSHHRGLGVGHFLVVDNGSDDGGAELLAGEADVSLWRTDHSYRLSRFGLDWLTWLMMRHGHGHWCLTVDADELFVYPHWPTRPLDALTDWLEQCEVEAMGALMLDLYPTGPLGEAFCPPGRDPTGILTHFDAGNYTIRRQEPMGNLWVQGGPRARMFFADDPRRAPTLQKVPLIRWNRRYVYVNSTHAALPRRLNRIYGEGERLTGILLHTKFLSDVVARSAEERVRGEHFANSDLYDAYYRRLMGDPVLHHRHGTRLRSWRHLEALGLMSRGGWV